MAVSKRTRFEVLRRDDFTCRYCRSKDNELTVDHVVPVALGGSDSPDNLVAACRDCNAGKSSSAPDQALIAKIEEDAVRWAIAMRLAAQKKSDERRERDEYVREFDDAWRAYKWTASSGETREVPRDAGWIASVWRFHEVGLPVEDLMDAIDISMAARRVVISEKWTYMCGVAWTKHREIQDLAMRVVRGSGS